VGRLVSLQLTESSGWQEWALKQHLTGVKIASERGQIKDRHGRLMAVSVPSASFFVRPAELRRSGLSFDTAAVQIAEVLNLNPESVKTTLKKDSPFIWLARQQPRNVIARVKKRKIPGVGHLTEARRYYPYNSAGSAIIGKTGID